MEHHKRMSAMHKPLCPRSRDDKAILNRKEVIER